MCAQLFSSQPQLAAFIHWDYPSWGQTDNLTFNGRNASCNRKIPGSYALGSSIFTIQRRQEIVLDSQSRLTRDAGWLKPMFSVACPCHTVASVPALTSVFVFRSYSGRIARPETMKMGMPLESKLSSLLSSSLQID
jgi:hypothetical protein